MLASRFLISLLSLSLMQGCSSQSPIFFDLAGLDGASARDMSGSDGFSLPDVGRIIFTVLDGDTDLPVPSRVIFRPVPGSGFADSIFSGTPDPRSRGGSVGAIVSPGVIGSTEGVILLSGQGTVRVPVGSYRLLFNRGPEYEMVEREIRVERDQVSTVVETLDRSVDTRGWLAADMHIHLEPSFDSDLRAERRVGAMLANGVEILVPTDHNIATDLQPTIDAMGYDGDMVGQVIGNEFNFKPGHAGAYPVSYSRNLPDGGAPPYSNDCAKSFGINCLEAPEAFPYMRSSVRKNDRDITAVTLNHPWWSGNDLGYLTNVGWGSGTPNEFTKPLASIGLFDAIEVLNGYLMHAEPISHLLRDWFYLLNHGLRVAALGNSDTHRINWVRGGYPRTWLRLPIDRPGEITGEMLAEAIKTGHAIASNGPFIDFTIGSAAVGDTVTVPANDELQLKILVDAPAWIDVDTVEVHINGVLKRTLPITAGHRPVLHELFVEKWNTNEDGWIVVITRGSKPLPADVVGEYSEANGYKMFPIAITNPIFIDGNGDGKWMMSPPQPGGPMQFRGSFAPEHVPPMPHQGDFPEHPIGGEPSLLAPSFLFRP